ncbi:cupredoxin domain-containing protein [Cohnella thermotolerans]|jgi:cytochrome c oxidase subunit 2|uniref:cupredoxin domain-containing protein n=1 Tax=Cohnella thermotolerans TaxID=329858 RepID=UPI0004059352|nr:cupredoxin domain-containing protein [Cohnella thermotolerans]
MNKKSCLFLAIVAMAAVLALSACGASKNNNAANSPSPTASGSASAGAPAAGGATKEITVDAKSFEFTPADIQLHVGDTVKLTLHNSNGNHGLEIPDLNVNLKNGESTTFTVDKAGTYDFNCSIQCGSGHDNMTGKITVS